MNKIIKNMDRMVKTQIPAKGGPASYWKRFTRVTAYLLLLTFVANILNIFVAPQAARAADPNMYLFWVGTCNDGSMPAGWSLVSDGAGEAFTDMFPRGNSSYSARAKTATTHTHSGTGASSPTVGATGRASSAGATHASVNAHTHAVTVDTVSSVNSIPVYKNMCVIKYTGIPTTIPQNAVAIFDTTFGGSWPTNWEDYSSTYRGGTDYFLRGGADTTTTGGNNAHTGAGHAVTATLGTVTGTVAGTAGTKAPSSVVGHTHAQPSPFNSDAPADTQPQYVTVVLGRATANAAIPSHMIAMFDGSGFTSYGWETVSDNGDDFYLRFPKVTGTYGTTGGADTHTHSQMNGTSTTYTPPGNNNAIAAGSAQAAHSHAMTVDLANGTDTNIPPYTDVIFAKQSYTFTTLTTDQASYPTSGETITMDSRVDNFSATNLTNTKIDYVIFIDANSSGAPDAGETYIVSGCGSSTTWASGNYTRQVTGLAVNANSFATDQQTCVNSNFPSNTTYTLWGKWYNSGDTVTYGTKSVTFTSVPTLTEILFLVLVGCAVFIGVKKGVIKLKPNDDKPKKDRGPTPPRLPLLRGGVGGVYDNNMPSKNNHQGHPAEHRVTRSIDGLDRKNIEARSTKYERND